MQQYIRSLPVLSLLLLCGASRLAHVRQQESYNFLQIYQEYKETLVALAVRPCPHLHPLTSPATHHCALSLPCRTT